MTQHSIAHPQSPHAPSHSSSHGPDRRRKAPRRASRLILWEWGVVLVLLAGLGITVLALSHAPNPRRDADLVVAHMKATLAGRPRGDSLFGTHPTLSGAGREMVVSMTRVPPKVCVLASWDLYRLGTVTINGVTPSRVSAAKLVELCNDGETATILWSPK